MRRMPLLLASVFGMPAVVYFATEGNGQDVFIGLIIGVYFLMLVPLACLTICGAMVRDELQSGTLSFLITRSITRARLILMQYSAQVLWIEGLAWVNASLLIAIGVWREVDGIWTLAMWLLLAQTLAVLVYGALGALIGLISRRYIVLGFFYGLVVEVGIGRIPTNIHALSMSYHLQNLMARVELVRDQFGWERGPIGFSVMVLLLGSLVFLCAALVLFTWREYHHNEDMQK